MAEIPKELRFLLFGRGAKWHARGSFTLDLLGMVCVVIGIIGDAMNRTLGLEATNWFILAGVLILYGMWSWLCAYTAAKEG